MIREEFFAELQKNLAEFKIPMRRHGDFCADVGRGRGFRIVTSTVGKVFGPDCAGEHFKVVNIKKLSKSIDNFLRLNKLQKQIVFNLQNGIKFHSFKDHKKVFCGNKVICGREIIDKLCEIGLVEECGDDDVVYKLAEH